MNDRLGASFLLLAGGIALIVWFARIGTPKQRAVMGAFLGRAPDLPVAPDPEKSLPFPGVKPLDPQLPGIEIKPRFDPIPGTVVPWGVMEG